MNRCATILFLALFSGPAAAAESSARDLEFFEKKIRPVLVTYCFQCHAGTKAKGGLRLDSREAAIKGGDSGPSLVPGDAEKSMLLDAIGYGKDLKMPPKAKMPASAIADLTAWIKKGAPWPASPAGEVSLRTSEAITAEDRGFWSFRPIVDPPLPAVQNEAWGKKPLDRFILAKLEAKGIKPVAAANKRVLIRRATFDLLGLPPTPEEIDAFLADESPQAFGRVVDRLLASPHYGERWSRYWLDVARYAEDQAHTFQARAYPSAYHYRDWVVKALQNDMPYDRFIMEQIAGDLLPEGDPLARLPALGYFALGPVYYADAGEAKAAEAAELDDRIDTLGRGFLGLTVACARCHDHKFDPISTQDYYALAGVFKSSKYAEAPLAPPDVVERFNAGQKSIKDHEEKTKKYLENEAVRQGESLTGQTAKYLLASWKFNKERKANPKYTAAMAAMSEGLHDTVVERWHKYLFEAGSDKRARLGDWRQAVIRLDKARDLTSFAAAWERARFTANAYQAELVKAQQNRAAAGAKQEKAEADWLKEILPPQGIFKVEANQAEKRLDEMGRKGLALLRAELETIKKAAPPKPPFAHSLAEGQPADMRIYIRGNVKKEGEVAPRHFLRILSTDNPPRFTKGSGRLELAKAIASPENPLTARVLVNRLWQHHFGRGLVATSSNFGKLGQKPTHPELLDHLARRFLAAGWSIKAMHREIMLSSTYQLGSDWDERNATLDGNNDYLWRAHRRRLDVEAWRDTLLAVTGSLDLTVGGPSLDLGAGGNRRRTLYAKVSRHDLNGLLRLFDFPDPNITSESRPTTIGPLQQLFVLNSGFMVEQARALVRGLAAEADDTAKVRKAYLRLYGRPASEREVQLARDFLSSPPIPGEPAPGLPRWEQYAQVLLSANELTFVD